MARIRISFLLLSGFVASVSAADVSGNWRLHVNLAGVPELGCTLTQKDQRLEGTCKAPDGATVDLNDGKINVDEVSWTWKVSTPDATTWTYVFVGTLDANGTTLKGVAKVSAGPGSKQNEMSFTATKQ